MQPASAKGRVALLFGVGTGLVIAGLLVVQAVTSSGLGAQSETATTSSASSTSSTASPSTQTSSTTTAASGSNTTSVGFHYVTFIDSGPCLDTYLTEWGVQLGNSTRTEPANITLSDIPEDGYSASSQFNLTRIVFLVPSGVYNFTLYPTSILAIGTPNGTELGGPTGVITVTNSDLTFYTIAPGAFTTSCSQ